MGIIRFDSQVRDYQDLQHANVEKEANLCSNLQKYTNADLKISLYDCVHAKKYLENS